MTDQRVSLIPTTSYGDALQYLRYQARFFDMNLDYNGVRAREILNKIYETEKSKAPDGIVDLNTFDVSDIQLKTLKWPPSVRIMAENDGIEEEMVFRMQGILCSMILPPLRNKPKVQSLSYIRNLRQHVKLTALGMSQFERTWEKVSEISDAFSLHLPGCAVMPLDFLPYEGDRSIEAHARYFTDRKLIPHEKNEAFLPGVDDHGILRSLQPDVFIHGPDNRVEYCRANETEAGILEHSAYDPVLFKPGDVVEILFSFVGIPIKEGRYRVLLNLRALTLLSSEPREIRVSKQVNQVSTAGTMSRRKRLYLSDAAPEPNPPTKRSRVHSTQYKPLRAAETTPSDFISDTTLHDEGYGSGGYETEDGELFERKETSYKRSRGFDEFGVEEIVVEDGEFEYDDDKPGQDHHGFLESPMKEDVALMQVD